jgi:hypothetical protein
MIAADEARGRTAGPVPRRERLVTSLVPLLPVLVALAVLEAAVVVERWAHEMPTRLRRSWQGGRGRSAAPRRHSTLGKAPST